MTVEHGMTVPQADADDESRPAQVARRAGDEAANVAETATESIREVADEVTAQAQAVAGQAKQQLDDFVGQARDEVRQQAQQRNEQVAGQLRTWSEQLTALAQGRPESAGPLVGYLEEVQDQVRRLATRLEQRGPQGVIDDVSNFARRRPGVFLAGAAGLGFVFGRVVRAAAAAQNGDSSSTQWAAPSRPAVATGPRTEPLLPQGNGPVGVTPGFSQ
jgi:polyhydroxyalkanoate synthesis regulator phasin